MYENIDEGLMPLAFVRRETHEILEDDLQQVEYERSNHHTLEGERGRSGRTTIRKAPDTYSDTVALLRGYAEVIKGHFSESTADSRPPPESSDACSSAKIPGRGPGTEK